MAASSRRYMLLVGVVAGVVIGSVLQVQAGAETAAGDNRVHPLGEYTPASDFAAVPAGTDWMKAIGTLAIVRDCQPANARVVDVVGTVAVERAPATGTSPNRSAQTEIAAMSMIGNDAVLGEVTVAQSETDASLGALTEVEGSPGFPVRSFFDVFAEVQLGDGTVLRNTNPRRIETTVYAIPPIEELYHSPAGAPLVSLVGDATRTWCLGEVQVAPTTPSQSVEKKEIIELAAEVRAMRAELQQMRTSMEGRFTDIDDFLVNVAARRSTRTVWTFIGHDVQPGIMKLNLLSSVDQTVTATLRGPGTSCGTQASTIQLRANQSSAVWPFNPFCFGRKFSLIVQGTASFWANVETAQYVQRDGKVVAVDSSINHGHHN